MTKVTEAWLDDWTGFYIDGQKSHEDHSLNLDILLQDLGIEFEQIQASDEYAYYGDPLPDHLDQLQKV